MSQRWLPQESIRRKRHGGRLSREELDAIAGGLADGSLSDAQAAAFAMAVSFRGMEPEECAEFTWAMRDSGEVFDWSGAGLSGPVLDKHSTGGVGDLVSLPLGPMLAACGAFVPMISGRGLGHTGGTLDKLEAIPGYEVHPGPERLRSVLARVGVAIVGAGKRLAPADRRLYAIRDVTATVDCIPLITASILSKKLAAGLQSLVLDVKVGNGAFCTDRGGARRLARSLVGVARAAGLPTVACLSDMNQVLGRTAGNALEMREAIEFLTGRGPRELRLETLTLSLAGEMLALAGLARDARAGAAQARTALASGAAAERFAGMVRALGGPSDVLNSRFTGLARAPVVQAIGAPRDGVVQAVDTRGLGLAVVELGGGRRRASDAIDPRVGLSDVLPLGTCVVRGQPLLRVHAATRAQAGAACTRIAGLITIADEAVPSGPILIERIAHG